MPGSKLTVPARLPPPPRARAVAGRLALACVLAAGAADAQAAGAGGRIAIQLTVLSQNVCRFTTPPPTTMDFGVLNLASPTPISMTVPAQITCAGRAATAVYGLTVGNGLYHNGSTRRMRHATALTSFLPYDASVSPSTGSAPRNAPVNLAITATIPVLAFQQAIEGLYSDTITVTVQP
jgi:spore coat protein U-like protein